MPEGKAARKDAEVGRFLEIRQDDSFDDIQNPLGESSFYDVGETRIGESRLDD